MPRSVVVLDMGAGEARIDGTRVAVAARPRGALMVGDCVLRPLSFGERWRLLDEVGDSAGIGTAVVAHSATAPPQSAGGGDAAVDPIILQILALHLAGARPERALHGVARQLADLIEAGWTPHEVLDADADLIDLISETSPPEDGWTSIVLAAEPAPPQSLAEVLCLLEDDLRHRLTPTAGGPEVGHHHGHSKAAEPHLAKDNATEHGDTRNTADRQPVDNTTLEAGTAGMTNGPTAGGPRHPYQREASVLPPVQPAPRASKASSPLMGVDAEATAPSGMRSSWTAEASTPSEWVPSAAAPRALTRGSRGNGPAGRQWPLPLRSMTDDEFMAPRPSGPGTVSDTTHGGGDNASGMTTMPTRRGTDPGAGRVVLAAPTSTPLPIDSPSLEAAAPGPRDVFELADRMAALLDEESDLRGLRP